MDAPRESQTFRDFMESALYDPVEGFYARRQPGADFYTAPELTPVFADVLAGEIGAILERLKAASPAAPLTLAEMGSGDGTLMRQVLAALRARRPDLAGEVRVVLIERVEALLMESLASLRSIKERLSGSTRLEEIEPFRGVLYSNELLDAFPAHLLEKRGGQVREVRVERDGGKYRETLGKPRDERLLKEAEKARLSLEEGQRRAVHLDALDWLARASSRLLAGALITVDYGGRLLSEGPNPVRTYFRHALGGSALKDPGRRDITASVDFAALISAGDRLGLAARYYGTLSRFLLERDILARLPAGDDLRSYQERNKMKTLFHPDGMGERFKVLIQERGA